MKRPIKFRARGIDGETYFGDVYHFKKVVGIHVCGDGTFEVIPESIAQLVGYDKDGNEVYEGDTVVSEYGDEIVARLMDNLPPKAKLQEAIK